MNNELLFALGVLARCFVILILCLGAIGKFVEFNKFSEGLVLSLGWSKKVVSCLGIGLILIEGGIAILLAFQGYLYEYALMASTVLFSIFFLFITSIILKNKVVTCNCFGKGEQKLSFIDSLRNILLIVATLLVYFVDIFSSIHFDFINLVYLLIFFCAINLVILTIYIKEIFRIFKYDPEAKYYG
jgi:hypothetical protein